MNGTCQVCQAKAFKYSCPKCETKTCSVDCVKRHKLETECDGRLAKRQKTLDMFDSRSQMTSEMMGTDLEFLFQGIDTINKSKEPDTSKLGHSQVVKRAKQLGCTVMIMPPTLNQHARNTSKMFKKRIHWRVEIMEGNERRVMENVDEECKMSDLLLPEQKHLQLELEQFEQPRVLVDLQATLQQCLQGKTIIEFPILHVVI
ncbi:hypothetical protein BASA81_008879 [Batrachochytrium salamandrivorans]|nr:hypothetical protein BASA81_008879 [Batrachochytrium salamandrivorans]